MNNYINIDKQFILTNINNDKLRVWLWILAKACDSRCVIDFVELRRGQLLLSTREMEKVLGISRRKARTICSKLAKEGVIECQPLAGKTTIVTVNNYDDYVVTHLRPTLNADNQKVKACSDPLATHLQEKATHLPTHSNECNITSYDMERPTYRPTKNFEQKETKETKESFPPHTPLYKEKKESKEKFVVVDTRTREKEEKFYEDVLADLLKRNILIEAFCKNEGISEDEFTKLSRYALEEIKFKNEGFFDATSLRNHLLNLIRIKTNNKKKQNGNEQTNIRRVGMEAIAYRPEDYKEAF